MVVLGIGSNLGNRKKNISRALWLLESLEILEDIKVSQTYESDALVPQGSLESWRIPFLNIAVSGNSTLAPLELLQKVKEIEKNIGRKNRERWAPREIDIDILAWPGIEVESSALRIPHPELTHRPFALLPLLDLIPAWAEGKIPDEWKTQMPFNTKTVAWRAAFPQLMGILNVTPDSFSDGGLNLQPAHAVTALNEMVESGAYIIDVGGESTRPGATPISSKEELERLNPVLPSLLLERRNKKMEFELSIDTRHAETAKKVLGLDVDWINDVSGGADPRMLEVIASHTCDVVIMHNLGIPADKNKILAEGIDVVDAILRWADERIEALEKYGVSKDRVIFDPGIGFGKNAKQGFEIIRRIAEFKSMGVRILVGHSRKSFLNLITNREFKERDIETLSASLWMSTRGVHYLRVHNVDMHNRAFHVWQKVRLPNW